MLCGEISNIEGSFVFTSVFRYDVALGFTKLTDSTVFCKPNNGLCETPTTPAVRERRGIDRGLNRDKLDFFRLHFEH